MEQKTNYTFKELFDRFPTELKDKISDTKQCPKWHPEGNVDKHIELVFNHARDHFGDIDLMISALFHDLGKADTTFLKEKKDGTFNWTSPRHENLAKDYITKYIELFSDITFNEEKVREVCRYHMKAHQYKDGSLKRPHKRKVFEDEKYFEDIIKFSECDEMGKKID